MRQCITLPNSVVLGKGFLSNASVRKPSFIFGMVWLLAVVAGLIMLSGCQSIPEQKVSVYSSKYQDIDDTCDALKTAIEAQGLQCPAIRNLNISMATHRVCLVRPIRVVEFCKAEYAHDMLNDNPEVCALMPCTFGVFEGKDNKIYISSRNQQIMSEMSGRIIAQTMNNSVARDQAEILKTVAVPTPITPSNRDFSNDICGGDLWCEMYIK